MKVLETYKRPYLNPTTLLLTHTEFSKVECPYCKEISEMFTYNLTKVSCCFKCRNKTHGDSRTKLYAVWDSMKQRCTNPNKDCYDRYGGKGVSVVFSSYEEFKEWALANGYEPNKNLSIDRIDSNGNYEPDNCRWISRGENAARAVRKKVIQFKLDKVTQIAVYGSAKEAGQMTGTNSGGIGRVCRGTNKSAGGYYWQFA